MRKSFGVVNQEPILFDENIGYNVAYNREETTYNYMELAWKILNFNNFFKQNIEETEKKQGNIELNSIYEKMVGPRGSHLSVGQKQRVAIARAAIRYPRVMLLDEATSALDKDNEERIEEILKDIMADKTVIKITHKL